MLVAAIISSAGSLSKSNVLMARQISSVSGQVWILDDVRANSESSRSSSMRPNSESFAISRSTIPEILQVSFDNNVLSRGVKSSLQAMHIVYEKVGRFEDIRPTIRDTQMLAQRRLRAP